MVRLPNLHPSLFSFYYQLVRERFGRFWLHELRRRKAPLVVSLGYPDNPWSLP